MNSLRLACRRITRIAFLDGRTSDSATLRPTTSFSRSRRITSTSGSSTYAPFAGARGPGSPRSDQLVTYASCAACCSASFFERPMPVPHSLPARRTVAVNSFW